MFMYYYTIIVCVIVEFLFGFLTKSKVGFTHS